MLRKTKKIKKLKNEIKKNLKKNISETNNQAKPIFRSSLEKVK